MTATMPCPFCGNAPNVREAGDPRREWWFVECVRPRSEDCPAFAYTGAATRDEAIRRWNTRNASKSPTETGNSP